MFENKTGCHHQKINCTVSSCVYNNCDSKECELNQIQVNPCLNCSSGKPEDESMCASYKVKNN